MLFNIQGNSTMIIGLTIYLILLAAALTFNYCAATLNKKADEDMERWCRQQVNQGESRC